MRILWIIDNKLRELWGIKEIKQTLKKSKIELILCNKFNWNLAIKHFSPDMIILPNIRVGSIFKFACNSTLSTNFAVAVCFKI